MCSSCHSEGGEELTEEAWNQVSDRHFGLNLSHIAVNPLKIHQKIYFPFTIVGLISLLPFWGTGGNTDLSYQLPCLGLLIRWHHLLPAAGIPGKGLLPLSMEDHHNPYPEPSPFPFTVFNEETHASRTEEKGHLVLEAHDCLSACNHLETNMIMDTSHSGRQCWTSHLLNGDCTSETATALWMAASFLCT